MTEIIISPEQDNKRLDHVLLSYLSETRSSFQKLIKSGEITLNQKPCKPHTFVKTGDILFFPKTSSIKKNVKKNLPSLEILFENEDVLVINKPAGIVVHAAQKQETRISIVDIIVKHDPKIKKVGEDKMRPGIVHRLDKDVSGVMVIAKTQKTYEDLKKQFHDRTVQKSYLALVYGKLPREHDVIKLKISRSKALGRMVARTGDQEGKEAITEYEVLDRFKNSTFVSVKIHTGRTHQIRVHFFAIDHPVVGDQLYKKRFIRHVKQRVLGRLFLHAHSLTFSLPNGEEKTIISPLPKELKSFLDSLPKK